MCGQVTTNQLTKFNDDQEFGEIFLNPSSNWDFFLSGRTNLDSNQEHFFLPGSYQRTRVPWRAKSFHRAPLPIYGGNQRLMDHIYWREVLRTWDRGTFNMPINNPYKHSRDHLFRVAWHDKGGCATLFKWRKGPRSPWLHRALFPNNHHLKASLSSSSTLCITSFAAPGYSHFSAH